MSAARAPLCRLTVNCGFTLARARIRWSFTCLVCVSVTEDTTSLQPSTSLRPSSPPTRLLASDHEDGFRKLMCYSFGSQYSGTRTRQHSCVFVLSGWIPKHAREHPRGESTLGERCSRHNDTSSVSQGCSHTVSMFWQALRRTQHHWNRRRRVVQKRGSDIHGAITWVSVRLSVSCGET